MVKGKRLSIKLRDKNRYDRTMKVKIVAEKIQIHCPLRVKTKTNQNENILGIDKGYKYLFATSSEKLYGENLNQYLSKETERLTKVNSNRNKLYAKYLIRT